jgi:hypothetical protein
MSNYEIENAIIGKATICIQDHGFLDSWLMLDFGGSGQGFGGYALYLPKSFTHHTVESHAGHWIYRILQIAGVQDWSELKGKAIRARRENGLLVAVGHITKDDWFCPRDDFRKSEAKA